MQWSLTSGLMPRGSDSSSTSLCVVGERSYSTSTTGLKAMFLWSIWTLRRCCHVSCLYTSYPSWILVASAKLLWSAGIGSFWQSRLVRSKIRFWGQNMRSDSEVRFRGQILRSHSEVWFKVNLFFWTNAFFFPKIFQELFSNDKVARKNLL